MIFNIDRLANKVKFDRYNVERQLGWALRRAVNQVVEVKFDKDGVPHCAWLMPQEKWTRCYG